MRVYLASSWRNEFYPSVLIEFQRWFDVYDFRDPESHFLWSEVDPDWQGWTREQYLMHLFTHPDVRSGFMSDMTALAGCDACVMLMPCGQSAHLEAGWAKGAGKKLAIVIPSDERWEPDLMYRMADLVTTEFGDVIDWLLGLENQADINRAHHRRPQVVR